MRRQWIPVAAAAVLAVIGTVEILLNPTYRGASAAALVAVVAGALISARLPLVGTAVVAAAFPIAVVGGLNGPSGAGVISFFLAPGWAGYARPPRRSWIAPLVAQLMASLGTWIAGQAAGSTVRGLGAMAWENLFFGSLCWGAWGVGLLARRLRDRAEVMARLAAALDAEREAREHAFVIEERQRIARDVHDAVAHSISVMVLQLGALRSTMPMDGPQAEMMAGVERLGRQSVLELRGLVGILRDSTTAVTAPQPSLHRTADLVAEVRAAGLPVALTVDGDLADLPRTLDVSAYRVLQEALTNVLRHAGPVPTDVVVAHDGSAVTVSVDNGPGEAQPLDGGPGGHGLVGMRERVAVFGGTLAAGPRGDGGYAVRATFPTGGAG